MHALPDLIPGRRRRLPAGWAGPAEQAGRSAWKAVASAGFVVQTGGIAIARDPLHTKICDMFGAEYPIFAFTHCKDVAVAVTNAGGVGVLGELSRTPDEIAQDIRWIRERVGSKPFGVDLVFPASAPPKVNLEDLEAQIPDEHRKFVQGIKERYHIPDPKPTNGVRRGISSGGLLSQEHARRQLEAVLEEGVPFLAAGLGTPGYVIEAAQARGIRVGSLIGKTRQARREIEAGVDVIIAQGTDAGGHTGDIGTFSLVPQVVAIAGETPVLAAGGVASGRHLAAALCLGAAGVWTGTVWLASRESDVDMIVKEKILAATDDDTIRTRSMTGKTARFLKNQWTAEWEAPGAPKPLPMPLQGLLSGPVTQAASQYKIEAFMGSPAGPAVGLIHAIRPCSEIVFDIVAEARDVLEGLAVG